MIRARVLLVAVTVAAIVAAGCSDGDEASPPPRDAVPERLTTFAQITVSAAGREVPVEGGLRTRLAPLIASKVFSDPEPDTAYGLDQPRALLHYERRGSGSPVDLSIGNTNFDRRGFYVRRRGDPRVFLVVGDALRPVLALVGIEVAPPTVE